MTTMTAAKAAAGSAAATEVTTVLSSITTSSPISEQDQDQQEQHQEKQQQEQISPSLWPISLMMTTMSNASGGAATAVVNSPSLASTPGGEGEQGVEKKKRRSIGAFFKGLAGKKFDSRNMGTAVAIPAAMTSSLSSNGEAVSSNSSSSSNDAAAEAEISLGIKEKHSPSEHSSPSSPLSSSLCAPRIKISVVAHMNGSEVRSVCFFCPLPSPRFRSTTHPPSISFSLLPSLPLSLYFFSHPAGDFHDVQVRPFPEGHGALLIHEEHRCPLG